MSDEEVEEDTTGGAVLFGPLDEAEEGNNQAFGLLVSTVKWEDEGGP